MIPLAVALPSGRVARVIAYAWGGGVHRALARADAAGHVYAYDPNQPRAPAGSEQGGQWVSTGSPLTLEQKERLRKLGVPPNWQKVVLNADPQADLQVTGFDAKGRKQYLYSAEHGERQAAAKFGRLREFNKEVSRLRESFRRDMGSVDPVVRESATVMRIIDKTAFRIGSRNDTGGAVKAFGVTTLRVEHVKINGDLVSFDFVGKHGVRNTKTITDGLLAREMASRVARGGELFSVREQQVRDYLHRRDGEFMVKDFRTWHGTNRALELVRSLPVPRTEGDLKRGMAKVSKAVAEHLGNTPAVARGSYIDPAVWSEWKAQLMKKTA